MTSISLPSPQKSMLLATSLHFLYLWKTGGNLPQDGVGFGDKSPDPDQTVGSPFWNNGTKVDWVQSSGQFPVIHTVIHTYPYISCALPRSLFHLLALGVLPEPSAFPVLIDLSAFSTSSYVGVGSRSPSSFISSTDSHVEYRNKQTETAVVFPPVRYLVLLSQGFSHRIHFLPIWPRDMLVLLVYYCTNLGRLYSN